MAYAPTRMQKSLTPSFVPNSHIERKKVKHDTVSLVNVRPGTSFYFLASKCHSCCMQCLREKMVMVDFSVTHPIWSEKKKNTHVKLAEECGRIITN